MYGKALEMMNKPEEAAKYFEQAWDLREATQGIRGSRADSDADYTISPMACHPTHRSANHESVWCGVRQQ
jgi:hypothetical protein